jgi:peptidyl-prolyl cis-trans isomerase SurA
MSLNGVTYDDRSEINDESESLVKKYIFSPETEAQFKVAQPNRQYLLYPTESPELNEVFDSSESDYFLLEEIGDISEPKSFTPDKQNAKKAFRIVRLDNRIEEHTANLKQDYERLESMALQRKQVKEVQKWMEKLRDQVYVKYHIDKPKVADPLQGRTPGPQKNKQSPNQNKETQPNIR